jgi:hypothetical protein
MIEEDEVPYGGRIWSGGLFRLPNVSNPKWVASHRGSPADYLMRYHRFAKKAVAKGLVGVRKAAPALFDLLTDERTLYTALQHMATHGGSAPGPDGLSYALIAEVGAWKWCRSIRETIRGGWYAPTWERVQRIPKGPGRGFRELVIQSVRDRVVDRAVVEVLQPLLDPLFTDTSFGYRPKRGPLLALATAERFYNSGAGGVWVAVDIKDAFPSVPLGRLRGVFRRYLPDERLLDFLTTVTTPGERPGLRQGSPASPLVLNLLLHHTLDRPWRESHPSIPLLRFADDILVLCASKREAREAYTALVRLLQAAGFAVKESLDAAVKFVAKGEPVKWMGYGIRGSGDGLAYTVTADAWDNLRDALSAAHAKPNSPIAAVRSIAGWVGDKGPCYPHTHLDRAYDRVRRSATEQAFEEIPDRDEWNELWQAGYEGWLGVRAKAAAPQAPAPA